MVPERAIQDKNNKNSFDHELSAMGAANDGVADKIPCMRASR